MDLQRRNFLAVGALVATMATPAFGQAVAPAVGPTYNGKHRSDHGFLGHLGAFQWI